MNCHDALIAPHEPRQSRAARGAHTLAALLILVTAASATAAAFAVPARAEESRMAGRVVNAETQAPIADAVVELSNMSAGQGYFRTRTDRSGAFSISGIAPNRFYSLTVSAPGYADFMLAAWQFPSAQRAVDVLVPLDRAGSLEVRVVRADGSTPVPGARVSVVSERGNRWWEGFRPPPAPAFSDKGGVARFIDLEAGSWTVTVESSDLLPAELRQVAVRRGETTRIPASLTRPASLAGEVRLADGTPAAGIAVVARGAAEAVGTSGADGIFSIDGLRPGRYRLNVSQEGFEPARSRETIVLREGETRPGITLTVAPRSAELALVLQREALVPGTAMTVGLRAFRVPSVDLTLFAIPAARLLDAQHDFRDLARSADTTGLDVSSRWQHVPPDGPPYAWREGQIKLPEDVKPGAYLLRARSGALDRRAILFVTDLGLLVKRSPTRALISAASLKTGEPVADAIVSLVPSAGPPSPEGPSWGRAVREARGGTLSTDARGLAEVPVPDGTRATRIVAVSATHGISVAESPLAPAAAQGGDRVYLYTERPIYRPGQTVYWKAFARKGSDVGYAPPDAGDANLTLSGPEGTSLEVHPVTLSARGSADGAVTLPREAPLGEWRLSAAVGRSSATATFAVQEYRKPEFRVEVSPDRDVYVNGDEVRFVIAANYFFGAPVFGANVRYNLFESRLRGELEDVEEEEGPPTGFGRVLQTGEARTDVDGRVALTMTPPRVAYDRRLTLEVEVVDAANRAVSGRGSAIVGRGLFTVQVRPVSSLFMAGQPVRIEVLTRDHRGKPVTADVTTELDQDAWSPLDRRYMRATRPLASATVTTDAQGRALLSLSPSPARAGYLQIRARADDAKGNRITDESSVWIYDALVSDYAYRYPSVEAFLDRDRYQPGDTARVLVNTDVRNAQVLATVEGRDLLDVQMVALAGNTGLIRIPIRPEYAPNVYVSIHVRHGKEIHSRTLDLSVAAPRHDLAIRLEPNRAEYRPGDAATIRVETRDGAGRPVRSEVSVGVVDEAIYSLRADATPDPHDVFYGKRPNWVTTVVSFPVLYYAGVDKGHEQEVRKDFRDVALWAPTVVTDDQGRAEVSLHWPDNLTTWRVTSRGVSDATLVGQAVAKTLVSKPLVARLAAPRMLIAGDTADLLSVVNNRSREPVLGVTESIEAGGAARVSGEGKRTRDLPASGESRSAWSIVAASTLQGDSSAAAFTFRAASKVDGDALQITTPVLARAVPLRSRGAGLAEGNSGAATVALPRDLIQPGSWVRIECSPSPAAMALSAVNYLGRYPYGCTEQTANAVLPAAALLDAARQAGATVPGWEDPTGKLAPYLERLGALQTPYGGWGWWREDDPDPYLTALALDALARAIRLGVATPQAGAALWQGARSMQQLLDGVRTLDGEAYVAAHLTSVLRVPDVTAQVPGLRLQVEDVLNTVHAARERLGTGALALAARAWAELGYPAEAKTLLDLLRKRAVSAAGETHWPADSDAYGWFGEEAENTGYALSALLAVAPDDPLGPSTVRWLAARREGGCWRSTRTTAPVAVALAEYLAARKSELRPEYRLRVQWNGGTVIERAVTAADAFGAGPIEVRLPGSKLRPGENRITIAKEGRGTAYFAWEARALVPSPGPDTAGEKRLSVTREYLRAERTSDRRGRPRYLVTAIPTGEPIKIGDAILVRLTLKAARPLHWLLLEDPRPAGFEVSELLPPGADWPYGTHAEQRDDRNVFFLDSVEEGETLIEYLVRPEVAGKFTALPATASGMYLPGLEARSKEANISIAGP